MIKSNQQDDISPFADEFAFTVLFLTVNISRKEGISMKFRIFIFYISAKRTCGMEIRLDMQ